LTATRSAVTTGRRAPSTYGECNMLTPSAAYLLGSFAIGVAQIVEACALLAYKGTPNRWLYIFALCEYAWAGISWLIWRTADGPVPFWIPASFVAYVGALSLVGLWVGLDNLTGSIVIPRPLVITGGLFGAYFAAASLACAAGY
jgi:hypothetical protein